MGDNLRYVPLVEQGPDPEAIWRPVTPDEDLRTGQCVPTSRERRDCGTYSMCTRQSDIDAGRAGGCSKRTHRFKEILPGLFAVFCAHGICLGFFFMHNHESPETFFTFLMQRRRVAPRLAVYDHACGWHAYCLNREPFFFKDTDFMVDTFHQGQAKGGHVACSSGYCIALFTEYKGLNEEVAEQMFSLLDRITTPVSFMSLENATVFTRLFFALQNNNRRAYWTGNGIHTMSSSRRTRIRILSLSFRRWYKP